MGEIKIDDIKALSVEERIDLIGRIWDTLAEKPEALPVPDAHRRILDERLEDVQADPSAGSSWPDVRRRITERP